MARIVLCGNDSKVPFVVFRVFVWLNRELFIIIVIIIIFLSFCSFAWGLSYRLCCFGFLFDYCCLVFSPINGSTAFHFMTIISHRIRNALALWEGSWDARVAASLCGLPFKCTVSMVYWINVLGLRFCRCYELPDNQLLGLSDDLSSELRSLFVREDVSLPWPLPINRSESQQYTD